MSSQRRVLVGGSSSRVGLLKPSLLWRSRGPLRGGDADLLRDRARRERGISLRECESSLWSEIRTLKTSGVCGADENAAFYVSSASPRNVSDHPDHFVNRQTYPKGS